MPSPGPSLDDVGRMKRGRYINETSHEYTTPAPPNPPFGCCHGSRSRAANSHAFACGQYQTSIAAGQQCRPDHEKIPIRQGKAPAKPLRRNHCGARPQAVPRMPGAAQCRCLPGLHTPMTKWARLALRLQKQPKNSATITSSSTRLTLSIIWQAHQTGDFLKYHEFSCYNSKLGGCSSAG